jgi:ribose 5-phosphate isomerase A
MSDRDALKRQVGEQAAAMVEDGMVVGLGTGSTATCFIDALIARVQGGLKIVGIPTSERSAEQARRGGITLGSFATHPHIDIAIDGADEIHRGNLALVKGLGGALLREKIVASAASRFVIIADDEKLVHSLGERCPVPVEVTPFGWELTCERLGECAKTAIRRKAADGTPYITDGGNFIIDCTLHQPSDAATTHASMIAIVGVIETGFFIGMAEQALIAGAGGIVRLERSAVHADL